MLWDAIKESKFAIMMGVMTIAEGVVDFSCRAFPNMWINIFRVAVFSGMTNEGIKRGVGIVRKEKVEEQYQEVADELLKLQNLICTISDFQEKREEEQFIQEMEEKFQKEFYYAQ